MEPETESSGPSLRDQFQHIQEQQRERYKHRKTSKLGNKENSDAVGRGHSAHETRFGKQDDLELKTATKELKATVVCGPATGYRDEQPVNTKEVDFLHRRLEQLQLENAQLHASLKGKERDVLELQRMREEEKVALGGVSSTATQRIVELSKKNRELTAELTAEKNKVRQAQRRLKEVEAIQQSASEPQKTLGVSLDAQPKNSHSGATTFSQSNDIESLPALAQVQEQLRQAKQKVTDYRNQCQLLKQDLKVAHKVLAQEVGEGINVSALLSGSGGWKGRAHQIVVLQNKLAELKQQLERAQNDPSTLQTSRSENRTPGQVDVRQKATLQKMESERKRNLEETRLELESVKSEYAKVQQQYIALKARNKTLTSDVKSLRSQLTSMLEKSAHSEKQVQAMTEKSSSSGKGETRGEKGDVQQWKHEWDVLQQANHSLQTQLCKCLAELQSLREKTPATRSSNSTPFPSSREGHDVSVSDAQVSLPPIVPPPSNRKPHRPPTRTIVRKSLSAGQPFTQQFNCDLVEAQTVAKIAQVERDRLLELTSTLQQRLDATTDKLVRLETELHNQRQHGTKPEKQLHTGQSRSTGNSHGSRQHGGSKVAGETGRKQSVRELESKLALQQDENVVLKETLELTRHEKMEDMKLLHGMLREAKQLFMDSVRKLRNE